MKAAKYEAGFAILCVICAAVFFVSAAISAEGGAAENIGDVVESTAAEQENMFTLMEHGGRIYVYSAGRPFTITDIDPEKLTAADREKLRQGIGAGDREALLQLLEDFGS